MVPCPKCRAPQLPDAQRCNVCGTPLGVAPTADEPTRDLSQTRALGSSGSTASSPPDQNAAAQAGGGFKKTMLGMPSFGPPAAGAGKSSAPPKAESKPPGAASSLNKTMLGVAPMAAPPGVGSAGPQKEGAGSVTGAQQPGGFKRTMMGVAPPDVIQSRVGATTRSAAPPAPNAQPNQIDPAKQQLGGTQVQFSPTTNASAAPSGGFSPSGTVQLPGPGDSPGADPNAPPPPAQPGGGSQQKTVMGVAMPGIAPIHPGLSKPAPAMLAPPPAPQPPEVSVPEPLADPPKRRLLYGLLLAAFVGLLLATVLAFYLLSSPYSVEARVVLDDKGQEHLEVSCSECPDGTSSEINGQMTTFESGKASVSLEDPLQVGNNSLTVSLLKPGDKHAETIELTVPVDYRVQGDLSGLGAEPPTVRISVRAIPGTTVVLDGAPLKLDAGGAGDYKLDVSEDLTGPADSIQKLERKVPYTITPPEGEPEHGEVKIQSLITPLTLDAPGPSIVIDKPNFMLAGQTMKGGSVSVAGRAITVDPTGRFAQLMSVSSAGETTIIVRGSAEDHAPRLVPVKIRRVDSLADEAKRLKGVSRTAFGDFANDVDKSKGNNVLVDARVVEARTDSHTTIILANVTSGCPHDVCLARVVYGAKLSLKKDEAVTVSGTVAGSVDGPRTGSKIVELQADFVVEGSS